MLAVIAAGCSSMHTLDVAPDNTAAFDVDPDGTMVLRSQKKHAVALRPLTTGFWHDLSYLPSFSIIVTNRGSGSLTLAPEDIEAHSGGLPVPVLDAVALQSQIAAYNASRPHTTAPRDAMQSSPQNTLRIPTPPPSARTLHEMLQRQTIAPGDSGGGRIMLDSRQIRSAVPLKIVVKVDGEKHTFLFSVKE